MKMRSKRGTISKRNSNARASNTEQSDDNSAGEMEREQRRVISNRLSQQRYREKGNEARDLLPLLYKRIADLERENNLLKDQMWRQRDPNGYAMAQQQQKEWITDGTSNSINNGGGDIIPNAFPQRVMSETSIPSLFNGHHQSAAVFQQQMTSTMTNCGPFISTTSNEATSAAEWQPTNVNGADFYVNSAASAANNNSGGSGGQQQQQNVVTTGGVAIARTRPIKRPSVRRSASALNIPMNVTNAAGNANNNNNNWAAPLQATSPQNQYLTAGNYGPGQSPQSYGHLPDGGQWFSNSNGPPLPQSPISAQQQQHQSFRCRSASITAATPTSENHHLLFNTSMGSNFGQSLPRQHHQQRRHSPAAADSPFEVAVMMQQKNQQQPAYLTTTNGHDQQQQQEQHLLSAGPPAPKRSSSFTDICTSYQQMNIHQQENMQVTAQAQVNEVQQYQQQQQQQVDGFFAPPFAYGIELDPNGPPQPIVSSANQAAQFAAFDRLTLTPINEDTPRLYLLEH